MKKAIYSPIRPIAKSKDSHRRGWAIIWADILKADIINSESIEPYDEVFLYHGFETPEGTTNLNYFLSEPSDYRELLEKFKKLRDFKGKITNLDWKIDYAQLGKSRQGDKAPDFYNEFRFKDIESRLKGANLLTMKDTYLDSLVVGDSHSAAVYEKGYAVNRNDYKTLHGALKQGLNTFVEGYSISDKIRFYFGNIDIRHHLARQADPENATRELVREYIGRAGGIASGRNLKLEIVEPLPIESEDRKLPKTGYYKGEPFHGSWKERNKIRDVFIDELNSQKIILFDLIEWPDYFYLPDGKLDQEVMEKPRSVHLSPNHYIMNQTTTNFW